MTRRARPPLAVTAVIFVAFVFTGFALAQSGEPDPAPSRYVVEIRGLQFQPAELRVMPGDTVVWINRDIVPHTATAIDGEWSSAGLERDESWQLVMGTNGISPYYCEYHPTMLGKLIAEGV